MTRWRRLVRLLGAPVTVVALLAVAPALSARPASAADEEPLYVGWSELLPGLAAGYQPSSANLCRAGHLRCVDAVVREMERRFRPLAAACDHDAVFALTYLRTTEAYREAAGTGSFFTDTPFVNHQDAVFAAYYFRAYDDWHAGRRSQVPPVWRVAFDAADRQAVSGLGNLLLGMAGHVKHDLPFVLAEIGLVRPDGSSRKVDHDRVNRILQRIVGPLVHEAAARFDPTVDDLQLGLTTLDETAIFQLLALWREQAWRQAELLVATPPGPARELVAETIAQEAALEARLIVQATSYLPLLTSPEGRNRWCAAQR